MTGIHYPEGATPLDPDELQGLRFKHVTTRSELDHLEQANIEDGLRWLARKKKIEVLSEGFVRTLHKKLFADVWTWAGQFRQREKNIGVDPVQIAVRLRMLLGDARYWVDHGTYTPLEAATRFHHRLVFIHPFPNGNGRHSRIMANALLTHVYRTEEIDWSGGYDLQAMNERRKDYIAALRAADAGDFQPLLAFTDNIKNRSNY